MITECKSCRLHAGAATFVFGDGDPDAKVWFVGEGPGPDEDREGFPWVGRAGRLLMRMLGEIELRREDVWLTNAVLCFPNDDGKIRAPAGDEVAACSKKWLHPGLRRAKPDVIVALGAVAAQAVTGRAIAITRDRGTVLQSPFCERVVLTLHPSYVLRGQGSERDDRMKKLREDFRLIKTIVDATRAGLGRIDVAEKVAEEKSIQLRDDEKAQFEQRIIQAEEWNPGRKYIAGWSDQRDVVLLYRDEEGGRRLEKIEAPPWYFYMRTGDALGIDERVWQRWRRLGVFERIELDPVNGDWTRVYAVRKVMQTRWLRDRGEVGVGINILDDPRKKRVSGAAWSASEEEDADLSAAQRRFEEARRQNQAEVRRWVQRQYDLVDRGERAEPVPTGFQRSGNWSKFVAEALLHDFLLKLHETGPTFEADLTPKQRFMTDHFLQIDDRYSELFFDIETDDSVPGWEDKSSWRHLSYAAVLKNRDGSIERYSLRIGEESEEAERALLREFAKIIDRADILYAWNGFNFDFQVMRDRFRLHEIKYDWRHVIWCDLLAVWRRYHYRSASAITSFSLEKLGPKVLKMNKLDWREESARRGVPCNRIIDMYRNLPDLLSEYNENDAEMLFKLEQEFGYAGIERVFCRIGNCFVNDYHVSTKIDMLLLNKGAVNGNHFYTRGLQLEFLPSYIAAQQTAQVKRLGVEGEVETVGKKGEGVEYTGAYVFPPVVGYHEGVAALDFKSLYPTIMTLFNISPETWVSREDVPGQTTDLDRLRELNLTLSPSGAYFRRDPPGMIPLVFRETMEKRKVYTKLQLGEEIGSERFLLYYRLSYAYKRLGLSFYGEVGNETSRYFNPEVAEAVTLGGQWFIKKTAEFAERRGYRVLAGDTDSIYLAMSQAQAEAFVKECDGYYREIIRPFNADPARFMMELEYENYFRNVIFVKKKRYAGKMTIFKGKASDYLEVKGLECMRSDGLERARAFQRKMLGVILDGGKPAAEEIARHVLAERDAVYSRKLPGEEIVETKAIAMDVDRYKTKLPHVRVAEHIRAVSTEYYVGMKVPFVMTPGPKLKNGAPGPLLATWLQEYEEGTYDPGYVWNKKVYPPTMRVLEAAYPGVDWGEHLVDERAAAKAARDAAKAAKKKKGPIVKRKGAKA